jgi:hypothetical protein
MPERGGLAARVPFRGASRVGAGLLGIFALVGILLLAPAFRNPIAASGVPFDQSSVCFTGSRPGDCALESAFGLPRVLSGGRGGPFLPYTDPGGSPRPEEDFVLVPQGEIGAIPSGFWGANLNFYTSPGYANPRLAALVNATPIRFLRLPLFGTYVVNQTVTNWTQVAEFCYWISCESEMTIGGPGYNASAVEGALRGLLDGVRFHPTYLVYGNEPNLWPSTTGYDYALDVENFTAEVRSLDPGARVLGAEITGHPGYGTSVIENVTRLDGQNISGFGLQIYPQIDATPTLAHFMAALQSNRSVTAEIADVRAEIRATCPGCDLPLFIDEFNGGSDPAYAPERAGEPDVPFIAASVIQAWQANVSRFLIWTLAADTNYKCDFGLVELQGACLANSPVNPSYYLYSQIFSYFAQGTLYNLSLPASQGLYGVVNVEGGNLTFLLVNANVTSPATVTLGPGVPSGRCVTEELIDPLDSGPAYSGQFPGPNGSARPTVSVAWPALSVEALRFPSSPGPCPPAPPSTGVDLLPVLGIGAAAGGILAAVWWRSSSRRPPAGRVRPRTRGVSSR